MSEFARLDSESGLTPLAAPLSACAFSNEVKMN